MTTGHYPYKNLVFEGGGVKGIAYGGALEVLEQSQIAPQIERVAGTSAGAITATIVSLNYTAGEFNDLMMSLDFEKFEDGSDIGGPVRLIERYGWFKGDYFLNFMQSCIKQKAGTRARPQHPEQALRGQMISTMLRQATTTYQTGVPCPIFCLAGFRIVKS
jgi:NTE family protein